MSRRRRSQVSIAFARILLVATLVAAGVVAVRREPAGTADSMSGMPGMSGMHHLQVPAAAYVEAAAAPLSRAGWTASASDQESSWFGSAPASNVLDGDNPTIWHSQWSSWTGPRPLPHSITIDMHATNVVSALTYLPRPSPGLNGRIGQFEVSLSDDGTTWGNPVTTGTWADDATVKTASFTQQATRFVRLTALSEAGNRGPYSSAAELNLLGASPTASEVEFVTANRAGWTAVASDEETGRADGRAGNVLDGSAMTIWHSSYAESSLSFPHSVTIDMVQATALAGLRYLPPPDGGSGTIGDYTISVSTDGASYTDVTSGSWAVGQSAKLATFASRTARFVRLTATSDADHAGPWSSAAEIDVLQQTSSAPSMGSWGPVINFPIVPVSAVLLPDNKVLTFSARTPTAFSTNSSTNAPDSNSLTQAAILDLATGTVGQRVISDTDHQMFCAGLALLPDGRLLVNGGSDSGATSIYSPSTNTWTKGPAMHIPRGYEGDTTLSNGNVFTLGGSWSGGQGNKDGEVFNPDGGWRLLPNVTAASILTERPANADRSDNHGWFFAVANGGVFHAGPSKQMNWFTTTGDGSQTSAGLRSTSTDAMNGSAVMYAVGKILTVGGGTAYTGGTASAAAYTVDIRKGPSQPVTAAQTGSLATPRAYNNTVVLPTGDVLVVGGQSHPVAFTDTSAAMSPELWSARTGRFTTMAPMAEPRNYHSVALLLPDGRVFSGGGGLCGLCSTNHSDGQIFTPPYLLNADGSNRARPSLSGTPATADRGTTISVSATAGLTKFALVRTGATTHGVDSDQRRIPLGVASAAGGTYGLKIPASSGVVLPGNYLLFAIDSRGTPSVSQPVRIS